MNISIPLALLEAASICSVKRDPRKYLNGVTLIDGFIISTDSERLFYCEHNSLLKLENQITIPSQSIERLIKNSGRNKQNALVEISDSLGDFHMCVDGDGNPVYEIFEPIESVFPAEWKHMIPDNDGMQYKGIIPHFNWKHMVDFQKINKILGAINPADTYLKPTGPDSAAHIYFYGNDYSKAKGLIMPIVERSAA